MMRRILPIALAALLALPALGAAADWGGIDAGVSTLEQVRERYGAPSKETRAKVEGYDTNQWIYESPRAPTGLVRMVVNFGLLTPGGYKPNVVRILRLEPKPGIYARNIVINGWGVPDGTSTEGEQTTFLYKVGLLVTFGKDGDNAVVMLFIVPQPDRPASLAPPRR
jgi:hypothetical protein